ncbi:unnamed protein product [Leptidea sinapis]|uniref:Major facilitator superfamily (MFS) profile domain-containing protein n=1 Tax=Leptidea sinapis TaxID=189913 RepID=A0A5E4R4X2_9NEOP|nr:unnamed protein product [Leptidea sinapis]
MKKAGYGCGIRHLQMGCMCLTMIALFIARGSMGVAVLAMTDTRRNNSKIEIPAGIIARRYGGKPVMLFSLLANGFVCGLLPSLVKVGDWKIVCACRMVMGLTQACLFPASHTMLGRWLPAHERTSYTGIVYSGPQIGIMIGMPLCGILSATAMGWKLIFYTISAIMFVQAAVWWYFAASTPGDHKMISKPEKEYIEKALNTAQISDSVALHPYNKSVLGGIGRSLRVFNGVRGTWRHLWCARGGTTRARYECARPLPS